jgi:hypothetical protein
MIETRHGSAMPLQDILYQLSMAQDVPDAELIDEFVRLHPEHAMAITDFAVELAVDALRSEQLMPAADTSQVSPAVSRAMSKFQNALHGLRSRKVTATPQRADGPVKIDNPFSKLDTASFRRLAGELKANSLFVSKLRDKGIAAATMTAGFLDFLASKMAVSLDVITAHFSATSATIPLGQFHKSEGKPEAGVQESFEEAVKNSNLTEEQQQFLLSL